MEILEDPVFKSQYQKYKVRVKLWESRFTKEHGRKPNKNDIKEADMKIKESYKMYWKLKTQALEETLTDITFCDDDAPSNTVESTPVDETKSNKPLRDSNSQSVENICDYDKQQTENAHEITSEKVHLKSTDKENVGNVESTGLREEQSSTVINTAIHKDNLENKDNENFKAVDTQDPKQSDVDSIIEDANECKNVKGVWGDHLSKANESIPKKKQTLLVGRSTSFQLSQNKFTSLSLVKRNPRKSLSAPKLKNKSDKDINAGKSMPEQTVNAEESNADSVDIKDTTTVFGESVKVTYMENKPVTHSVSTVQQLIEGYTVNRNLNAGWLDRCSRKSNLTYPVLDSQRLSGTSDSGIDLIDSNIQSPKDSMPTESQKSFQISDEEDFVCNSDTEEELRKKRIRNFKKRLSDQESNPSKRLCTNIHDNLNTMQTIQSSTIDNKIVNVENSIINDSNKTTIESNNANSRKNDIKDCNEEIKDVSDAVGTHETVEEPRRVKRNVRRRIKRISSDDSDPDYNESSEIEEKKTRRKRSGKTVPATDEIKNKAKSKRTYRKKKDQQDDEDDVSGIGTTRKSRSTEKVTNEAKPKRMSRRKKDVKNESDNEDVQSEGNKRNHIYGVETFTAVPRFAISKSSQGDLIQQFATSVSSKVDDAESAVAPRTAKDKYLTDKEKLEKKIVDGKVNENFVRINLKKKVFVRGKKHFNFSKYKKNQWKEKKKELASSEGSLAVADFVEKVGTHGCFICGDLDHFSRRCPKRKGDDLVPLDEIDETSEFPTLEEAQEMASKDAVAAHASRIDRLPEKPSYSPVKTGEEAENEGTEHWNDDLWEPIEDEELLCGHKIPEDLVQQLLPPEKDVVQPLYPTNEDQSLIDTPAEVFETLRMFGHTTFRPGQEKAIMRILSGHSTLVTLSTGSGKSLCYQLPAYLYSKRSNSITLVISPLVSLMDDQVTGMPSFMRGACLHTNQTEKVRNNVMEMVKNGQLNILLISPEAVVAGEKSTGFGALLRQLPPIAFACIDEAHCISQWSHNFRPSYLMVCRVLKEKLRVRTVLALTATATKATAESIVSHLGIHDGMAGVISDIPMPRNLLLTVSKDENRDHALVDLLLSKRFEECDSIIVYCTRREECARIAGLLRTSLQNYVNKYENPKSKLSSIAEAYHAGLTAYRRKAVQKAFMNGQVRIVVATVAFGMGLNKPDIRAVIHYNMPGTFEGYVQEVGRAGRDGLPAHCHLFLNPTEDKDKWELRRHIYANGVDRHMIRRLLQKVFIPCSCGKLREKNANYRCPGHEVAIPINETVAALDIPEEIISTLLCYLELHPRRFITVLSSVYVKARVSSYIGREGLKQAAQSSPPLAMAIAMELQKGISHDDSSVIEFPVVDVASAIGWDSGVVKSHLKNLEWKTVNGVSKRSAISVRYDTLGLRVKAPGDLTDEELDEALDALYSRTQAQENAALQQLETIGMTLHKFSMPSVSQCLAINDEINAKSDQLKDVIRNYFAGETLVDMDAIRQKEMENEAQVASDVRNMIVSYRDNSFTGRAVARIFHGIQSPNYPAYVWNKCRFWRAHLSSDFNALCALATKEILALR